MIRTCLSFTLFVLVDIPLFVAVCAPLVVIAAVCGGIGYVAYRLVMCITDLIMWLDSLTQVKEGD